MVSRPAARSNVVPIGGRVAAAPAEEFEESAATQISSDPMGMLGELEESDRRSAPVARGTADARKIGSQTMEASIDELFDANMIPDYLKGPVGQGRVATPIDMPAARVPEREHRDSFAPAPVLANAPIPPAPTPTFDQGQPRVGYASAGDPPSRASLVPESLQRRVSILPGGRGPSVPVALYIAIVAGVLFSTAVGIVIGVKFLAAPAAVVPQPVCPGATNERCSKRATQRRKHGNDCFERRI